MRLSSGTSMVSCYQARLRSNTNVVGSRLMDIKAKRISLLLITFGVTIVQCPSRTIQAPPPTERQSPLSRRVAKISIQTTSFLDALFQIGRSSNQCMGIVLVQRSSALAEVPSINAENITVGDLLTKLLMATKR